jgi:2-polyprenyl-3-methyl-5-hydroxy-6-metoxy-1,4-benzoquinol methylase
MHAIDGGDRDNYLNHPLVAAYTSLRALGNITSHLDVVIAEIRTKTPAGGRILSPGCGAGRKEIALARALPDRVIIAGDIAESALQQGREQAAREGVTNIEFVSQNFNDLHLEPKSFHAIAGMGAFHHVENLEAFWLECRRALRPGGVIMGQEYIGPDRFQWTDAQVEEGDRVLRDIVPAAHKVHHTRVVRTPVAEMIAADPSEAVRSSELLGTLKAVGFELFGYASAGGALLQPVLLNQVHTFDPKDWAHNLVLSRLFAEEDRLMREGRLKDDFCMFVTQPLT